MSLSQTTKVKMRPKTIKVTRSLKMPKVMKKFRITNMEMPQRKKNIFLTMNTRTKNRNTKLPQTNTEMTTKLRQWKENQPLLNECPTKEIKGTKPKQQHRKQFIGYNNTQNSGQGTGHKPRSADNGNQWAPKESDFVTRTYDLQPRKAGKPSRFTTAMDNPHNSKSYNTPPLQLLQTKMWTPCN